MNITQSFYSSETNSSRQLTTSKLCRPTADIFCWRLLDLKSFELKNDTPITPVMGNVHLNADFSAPFLFELRAYKGRNGQKNEREKSVGLIRPILRRAHNKLNV